MFSPWALRSILDAQQTISKGGLKVYLRVMNHVASDDQVGGDDEYASYGFQTSVTGGDISGTSDLEINPPPDVQPMSDRNIGLAGGRLRFGAHSFMISHTWVKERMADMGYDDPYQVFRDESVVGLFYDGRVFSIEDVTGEAVANEFVSWTILANG